MLRSMTWTQFQEWLLYYQEEPFGEDRDDLRAGSVVAAIYNVNRVKGGKVLTASDCRLVFSKTTRYRNDGPAQIAETPEMARARFDQFKQMIIANATQGASR